MSRDELEHRLRLRADEEFELIEVDVAAGDTECPPPNITFPSELLHCDRRCDRRKRTETVVQIRTFYYN